MKLSAAPIGHSSTFLSTMRAIDGLRPLRRRKAFQTVEKEAHTLPLSFLPFPIERMYLLKIAIPA